MVNSFETEFKFNQKRGVGKGAVAFLLAVFNEERLDVG
jgi:hypothetical protein